MGTPVSTVEVLQKKAYETLRSEKPTEAELDALQKTFENEHGSQVLEQLRAQVDVQAKEAPFIMANLDELSKRVGTKVELRAELGKFSTELRVKSDAATLDAAQKAEAQLQQSATPGEKPAQDKKAPAGAPKPEEDHKIRNYLLTGAGVVVTALGIRWLYKRFMSSREEGKKAAEGKEGGWFKKLLWGAGIGTAAFFGYHMVKEGGNAIKAVNNAKNDVVKAKDEFFGLLGKAKDAGKTGLHVAGKGLDGVGRAFDKVKRRDPLPKEGDFKSPVEYGKALTKYIQEHNGTPPRREDFETQEKYEKAVLLMAEEHLNQGGELTFVGGLLSFAKVTMDVGEFKDKFKRWMEDKNRTNSGELAEIYTEGAAMYIMSFGVIDFLKNGHVCNLPNALGWAAAKSLGWPLAVPINILKGGVHGLVLLVEGAEHPAILRTKVEIDAWKLKHDRFLEFFKNKMFNRWNEKDIEHLMKQRTLWSNYANNTGLTRELRDLAQHNEGKIFSTLKTAVSQFHLINGKIPSSLSAHASELDVMLKAGASGVDDARLRDILKDPTKAGVTSNPAQPSSAPIPAKAPSTPNAPAAAITTAASNVGNLNLGSLSDDADAMQKFGKNCTQSGIPLKNAVASLGNSKLFENKAVFSALAELTPANFKVVMTYLERNALNPEAAKRLGEFLATQATGTLTPELLEQGMKASVVNYLGNALLSTDKWKEEWKKTQKAGDIKSRLEVAGRNLQAARDKTLKVLTKERSATDLLKTGADKLTKGIAALGANISSGLQSAKNGVANGVKSIGATVGKSSRYLAEKVLPKNWAGITPLNTVPAATATVTASTAVNGVAATAVETATKTGLATKVGGLAMGGLKTLGPGMVVNIASEKFIPKFDVQEGSFTTVGGYLKEGVNNLRTTTIDMGSGAVGRGGPLGAVIGGLFNIGKMAWRGGGYTKDIVKTISSEWGRGAKLDKKLQEINEKKAQKNQRFTSTKPAPSTDTLDEGKRNETVSA